MSPIATPTICSNTFAVNFNSRYVKSACFVRQARNYTDARLTCYSNGMQLFDINEWTNSVAKAELLKFANSIWPARSGSTFFVKGRKNSECININNVAGNFTQGISSCNQLVWSVCQFVLAV